jgi:hypothetical protein
MKKNDSMMCYIFIFDSIDAKQFETHHIKSENEGGTITKDNLRPIYEVCNKSIGNMDMNEYKHKYYK